ncbi:hypothetical protein [Streptomyces montanus]|nr:hypothetical protein [Streptomyces montanus]
MRSAAELNERIRGFFTHRDKRLSDAERAEYAALLPLWAEAVRDEVVKAA